MLNRMIVALALIVLMVMGSYGCRTESPAPPPAGQSNTAAVTDRRVLTTIPFGNGSPHSYELSIGKCADQSCPVEVRLMSQDKVLDTARLEWSAASDQAETAILEPSAGAGDPLETSSNVQAWTTGSGEKTLIVAARSVRLGEGSIGLLIDQMAGFEHPKRRHVLFVNDQNKLAQAWTGTEPQGPYWSSVAVRERAGEPVDDLVYFSGFYSPGDTDPDTVEVRRLSLNSSLRKFEESPMTTGVFAVVAGGYDTVKAARAARTRAAGCIDAYLLLDREKLGVAGSRRIVLAALTSREELAQNAIQQARNCSTPVEGVVVPVTNKQ